MVDGALSKTGAPALRCRNCSGLWVPPEVILLDASVQVLSRLDAGAARTAGEERRTGQCPDAHGLLRRARVTWHDPYFLERCARCGGVWFDAGEWSRVAADDLFADLSQIWSPAWRKRLSDQQSREALEVDLRIKLGVELFELLHLVATRLEVHPQRGVALAYLSERLKHPADFSEEEP